MLLSSRESRRQKNFIFAPGGKRKGERDLNFLGRIGRTDFIRGSDIWPEIEAMNYAICRSEGGEKKGGTKKS